MNNISVKGNSGSVGGSMKLFLSILDPSLKELTHLLEENEQSENFEFCKVIKEAIHDKKELHTKIESSECYWDGKNIEDMSNEELIISFKHLLYKYEKSDVDFRCQEAAGIRARNDLIFLRFKTINK